MTPPRVDPDEIQRTLCALFPAGTVTEVRIPKTDRDGTISGYFNDWPKLALAVGKRNGSAPGVYLTLNPVNPSLLARAENRLKIRARVTTSDADIERRARLLIDCDAVRPAEISSSDAEHEAALEKARDIRLVLGEEGWPTPILADSGNGAHLIYGLDLPNDETSTKLVQDVLKALSQRFNDERVKIDQAVYNAGRIVRIYGTVAAKGDSTADRPHRLSRLLDVPDELAAVPRDLLEAVGGQVEPPPPRNKNFDLKKFIASHLNAREPVPHEGGRKWVLTECPFNPEHQNSAVFENADGSIGFHCFHASCADKRWADVRMQLEPPQAERAKARQQTNPSTNGKGALVLPRILSAREIRKMDLPKHAFLIEGLLTTPGAWLLDGPSKHGKTIFAMQLSLDYQANQAFLGNYQIVASRPALFVQKDDKLGIRSVREILDLYNGPQDDFFLADQVAFELGDIFYAWLRMQIREYKAGLVVLDSYTSLRPYRKGGDVVKTESEDFGALDELAIATNCTILIVHHDSKGSVRLEWDQRAGGSFGIPQAVQGIIRVSRFSELRPKANERLVQARARHGSDEALALSFVKEKMAYDLLLSGDAAICYPDLAFLRKHMGDRSFSPKELAQETGLSRSSVMKMLRPLYESDALQKVSYGCYKIAAF
jgi:hypothetical protein